MKYIIRVGKYFIYVSILLVLILTILVSLNLVEGHIDSLFKEGWLSVLKLVGVLAVISAVYPYFGYGIKYIRIENIENLNEKIITYMNSRNYILEKKDGENMTFRSTLIRTKLLRVWEDRITLNRILSGYEVEGPTRDIVVIAFGLEQYLNKEEL